VVLVDHTRFGVLAFTTIVQPQSVEILITDAEPDTATKKWLAQQGTRLLIAQNTRR
jgi:DeoR/GlpR family transcriptional regulator of sugar metabolism